MRRKPWPRRLARLAALLLIASGGAAVLAENLGGGAPAVTDADGRRVSIAAPARRIVALAPHIVENLFALGAGPQLVGAVDYSDFPEGAQAIPRVGGVGGISLERLAQREPDLVIAWGSATPPAVLAVLENLDIPYYVDEIRSLEDLAKSFERLGRLTGHDASGRTLATRVRIAGRADSPGETAQPQVFLQLWDQPLQSIGGDHLLTEVIGRCGGRSITADAAGLAPQISIEAVVSVDPDLIVVESAAQARHWNRFPDLRAHASPGAIRVIDPDLLYRPTLRLLRGMDALCEAIAEARAELTAPL